VIYQNVPMDDDSAILGSHGCTGIFVQGYNYEGW